MVPSKRTIFREKKLDFERERLLLLIGSRISRKDLDIAQNLAGDLYDVEMEFALHQKLAKLKRFNKLVFIIILLALPVLIAAMTFTVLGLRPFFYLLVLAVVLIFIVSFILLNALFVRHFENNVAIIMDAYDTRKQSFISRLIEHFSNCRSPAGDQTFSLPAIKRDLGRWACGVTWRW